ncbi:MAG: lipase chaperone [bacterium]|nr:lipase chaperone [bacterium]
MDKKKIIALVILVVLVIIVYKLASRDSKGGYIYDSDSNITLKDAMLSHKRYNLDEKDTKELFSKDIINPYTLKFLKSLQSKFKEGSNFEDYFEQIREYLYTLMPAEEADKLLALYKKFVKYELDVTKKIQSWGKAENAEDAIYQLKKLREYQREFFGKDIAEALFGADIKAREYPIRRNSITKNADMSGAEKEELLEELNSDMWGDEAEQAEQVGANRKPYDKYKEKLDIYQKDLNEAGSSEEKSALIGKFREEYFTAEQITRLEDVDQQLAAEKQIESEYSLKKEDILNDNSLSEKEKETKVKELRDETFGENAEMIRRREDMRKAGEALKNK